MEIEMPTAGVFYKKTRDNSLIVDEDASPGCFGARHILAILAFLAFTPFYGMSISLSVAIVAMLNQTMEEEEGPAHVALSCPIPVHEHDNGTDASSEGEFNWDEKTQGFILGSYFYGYALTNILGGVAAEYLGGRLVTGTGIVFTSFLTIASPAAARFSTGLFIALRVLIGIGAGVIIPGISNIVAKWYPTNERSKFSGTIFGGIQFGIGCSLSIAGALSASEFMGGWPSVFYIFGLVGLIWGGFWFWLVRDNPTDHPYISDVELKYIVKGCGPPKKRAPVPLAAILTSKYFWAIAIMHLGNNWGFYTLLTMLPTYLSRILHVDIQGSGVMSALPWLMGWVFNQICCFVVGKLVAKGTITNTTVRKFAMAVGGYGPMVGFIVMCFVNCNQTLAFLFLILSGTFNGSVNLGHLSSHADISPRFSGTLMGMTNTFATIPGFVAPAITGAITEGNQTIAAWRIVFIISALVYGVTVTIYLLLFKAEIQPWNEVESRTTPENPTQKDSPGKTKDSPI